MSQKCHKNGSHWTRSVAADARFAEPWSNNLLERNVHLGRKEVCETNFTETREPSPARCSWRRSVGLLAAGPLSADPLNRLSADFQNNTSVGGSGEISTSAPPPGIIVYTKAVNRFSPSGAQFNTLYVTFSAQADVHNGSALLMQASVDGTFCQPLLGQTDIGGGGGLTVPFWYTLLNVPAPTASTNCDNGGGGTGDCHDNTIYFSCCAKLTPCTTDSTKCTNPVVTIKLADEPGTAPNTAFYERSTIYIDGETGSHCTPHGVP
jgi:hypothetical protein